MHGGNGIVVPANEGILQKNMYAKVLQTLKIFVLCLSCVVHIHTYYVQYVNVFSSEATLWPTLYVRSSSGGNYSAAISKIWVRFCVKIYPTTLLVRRSVCNALGTTDFLKVFTLSFCPTILPLYVLDLLCFL